MNQDLADLITLQLTSGVGNGNIKTLISYVGSAANVLGSSKRELHKIPGIGEKTIDHILSKSSQKITDDIISACDKLDIKIIDYLSPAYPKRLIQIPDAPVILYQKGNCDLNPQHTISIVGTRNATNYGKEVVQKSVKELTNFNVMTISGLAYGIDVECHRMSLTEGIPTIGVLAGGLENVYPRAHQKIAERMLENGSLLSEYPPGTKPEPHLFPARNRIIAGLGDATLVVEAAEKGGALITAELADSYSRPVFAVPGDLNSKFSKGCNNLIRIQKALMFTGIKDIVYYLNWDVDSENQKSKIDYGIFSNGEKAIIGALEESKEGLPIDELAWNAQLPVNEIASILLNLEFQGYIQSLPGKRYLLKLS